jgi:hypothetical protein
MFETHVSFYSSSIFVSLKFMFSYSRHVYFLHFFGTDGMNEVCAHENVKYLKRINAQRLKICEIFVFHDTRKVVNSFLDDFRILGGVGT